MKQYPSINKRIIYDIPVHIFSKYDGSGLRVEFSPKKGFHKHGRRHGLLDDTNPILKRAPDLFEKKYGVDLQEILAAQKWQACTLFYEFFGPKSFAGAHDPADKFDVVLFDVDVYKQGLLPPKEFVDLFGSLKVQNLLHCGEFTEALEERIRNSTLLGMPFEGVVCKSAPQKRGQPPLMFKVKSNAWLAKLRSACNGNEKLFEQMS